MRLVAAHAAVDVRELRSGDARHRPPPDSVHSRPRIPPGGQAHGEALLAWIHLRLMHILQASRAARLRRPSLDMAHKISSSPPSFFTRKNPNATSALPLTQSLRFGTDRYAFGGSPWPRAGQVLQTLSSPS